MNKTHGSPYDRGSCDSWYMRPRRPHHRLGDVECTDLTPTQVAEYMLGYNDNEATGQHKEY